MKEGGSINSLGTVENADATELAIIKFVDQLGVDYADYRTRLHGTRLLRFPFDSGRKRMTTFAQYDQSMKETVPTETGYPVRMHTKGAAEKIMETCSHYLDHEGKKQELTDQVL